MQCVDRFGDPTSDRDRFPDGKPAARLEPRRQRLPEQRRHRHETRAVLGHAVFEDDDEPLAARARENLDCPAQPIVELIVESGLGKDLERDLAAGWRPPRRDRSTRWSPTSTRPENRYLPQILGAVSSTPLLGESLARIVSDPSVLPKTRLNQRHCRGYRATTKRLLRDTMRTECA